ncbi:MAG: hypothetical protein GYA55_14775, partial [SAR324 cluster bacterium]|nr:hypothetical protein [SAR324 cluster bacterium]
MSLVDFFYRSEGKNSLDWMRKIQSTFQERIRERATRLNHHLNWCRQHVPFYADHLPADGDPFERLKRLPIFPKRDIKLQLDQFIATTREKGSSWDHTSGTSGKTFHFLVSPREKVYRRAYELFANDLLGFAPGCKHLVIWGGHESKGVKNHLRIGLYNLLSGRELITIPGTEKKNFHVLQCALARHSKGVLITYPSILLGLCEMGCATQLQSFRSILLSGEASRFELFEPYGLQNLKNRYGTREFGAIAC